MLAWSPYALETYSNAELIAINQDALGSPARRIAGGDLPFPCASGGDGVLASVSALPCDPSDARQLWSYNATTGRIASSAFPGGVLDDLHCDKAPGSPVGVYPNDGSGGGTCGGANQNWTWGANGSIINAWTGTCLDVYDFAGPAVDVYSCNGGVNQVFTLSSDGHISTQAGGGHPALCLTATAPIPQQCANVWGRLLANGDYALGMLNNDGGAPAANVMCDAACFALLLNGTSPARLRVRDLWAHADVGTISAPFSWTAIVNGSGSAQAFRLTPV